MSPARDRPRSPRALGDRRRWALLAAAAVASTLVVGSRLDLGANGNQDPPRAAAPADAMNIVVVMTDDQPLRSLRFMPYLRKATKRGWVRFTDSVVNNAICCPSRVTGLTGLYSHRTGVNRNGADARNWDDSSALPTWLQEAGYETTYIGKYLNDYPWQRGDDYVPAGWDRWVGLSGKPDYYDYTLSIDGSPKSFGDEPRHYVGRMIERQALRSLKAGTRSERPFLLYVAHYTPHRRTVADPRDEGKLADARLRLPPNVNEENVNDKPRWVQEARQRRLGKLRGQLRDMGEGLIGVDRLVRKLVKQLRQSGELERTLIVFTADHGFALGEHRHFKKSCAYEECTAVPLLVRYPGARPGLRTVDDLVANVDLVPTYLAVSGAEAPHEPDGRSLLPLLRGTGGDGRRAIPLRKAQETGASPTFWGLRTPRHKYVELETGERELYYLKRDPFELRNRYGKPGSLELQGRLAARLKQLREG